MVIFAGVPCWSIALHKKRKAALRSRFAVSRKSTVFPVLSTARYKYFHRPLISLIQQRHIFEHPAAHTGVVDLYTALFHHLLELAVADRIRHVPTYAPEDDLPFKMTTF